MEFTRKQLYITFLPFHALPLPMNLFLPPQALLKAGHNVNSLDIEHLGKVCVTVVY